MTNESIKGNVDVVYQETLESVWKSIETEDVDGKLKMLSELHKERMEEQKNALAIKEQRSNARHRLIQVGVGIAAVVIPAAVNSYWMARGMEFESSGTYTSKTLKWVRDGLSLIRK